MGNCRLMNLVRFMYSLFFVLSIFGCTEELEFEAAPQELENVANKKHIEATKEVDYIGKTFYLGSSDKIQSLQATRSLSPKGMLTRSFNIDVRESGENYLGVHIMAAYINENSDLQNVEVWVNDKFVGELAINKAEWDFVTLNGGEKIRLNSGNNTITFASLPPYYPEIDAIQIESNIQSLIDSDPQYDDFIAQLILNKESVFEKVEQSDLEELALNSNKNNSFTRSAYNDSYDWQVTPKTLSNPDGNYKHCMCVPVTYTYHRKLSLSKGTYTFMTGPIEGDDYYTVDPVMYLYKIDDPHNYSYYSDDASGKGRHPELTVNIPAGDYYLVIRAYSSYYASSTTGRQGLVNVFQNGNILNSQCPVAGYIVDVDSPNTGIINYFTAYTTGLPEFFLEEKASKKVKFLGESYFYASPMEEMWMDDARLRLTKPSSNDRYRMIISCVGAFGAYYGNCDVYGSCQQVQAGDRVANAFPNLMVNDGIYSSANETNVYNCASWAGGLTSGWTWGGIYGDSESGQLVGPNYGSPYIWNSWDDFFGNSPQRYAGATVYTRDDADATNGEIAVWSSNGSISGVTHFSCRGTANNQPHGYAWESKPGELRRIFHPRDAVRGTYGNIFAYYRDASKPAYGSPMTRTIRNGGSTSISMEESIERGLTVIEEVKLTEAEKVLFSNVQTRSSVTFDTENIKKLYSAWTNKIGSSEYLHISNPYTLIETKEGKELISYCKANRKEALAFFVNLYFMEDSETVAKAVSYYIFCNVFSDYAEIIENIKNDWKNNQYNENGAYIAPTPQLFLKKFVKSLIPKII